VFCIDFVAIYPKPGQRGPVVTVQSLDETGVGAVAMRASLAGRAGRLDSLAPVHHSRFSQHLLIGASVVVLAALLPSMAFGQAVPPECTPDPAIAGATINCEVAAPAVVGGIATTVDDLTINIGSVLTEKPRDFVIEPGLTPGGVRQCYYKVETAILEMICDKRQNIVQPNG
jgi:hypothetical protein